MAGNGDTRQILGAIKELAAGIKDQGERSERISGELATEIRGLGESIVKGFAAQRAMPTPTPITSNGRANLLAIAGLMFGLMSPMYFVLKDSRDALTAHSVSRAHPLAAAELSAYQEKLVEIETQFAGVRDVAEIHHKRSAADIDKIEEWKQGWEGRVRALDSRQSERIRFLWMNVFGNDAALQRNGP